MRTLFDTSIAIAIEHGKMDESTLQDFGEVSIAAITWSELWAGVHLADSKKREQQKRERLETLLIGIPILPFDTAAAEIHAQIWAPLRKKGELIGAHDMIIAATALAHDLPLLTLNKREFKRVSGLKLV